MYRNEFGATIERAILVWVEENFPGAGELMVVAEIPWGPIWRHELKSSGSLTLTEQLSCSAGDNCSVNVKLIRMSFERGNMPKNRNGWRTMNTRCQ